MTALHVRSLPLTAGVRLSFVALTFVVAQIVVSSTAVAQRTTLELEILPIDCQFEIIDDGQNTINYITPEECGQIVEPEPGPDTDQPAQQPTVTQSESQNVPFLFAVPAADLPDAASDGSDDDSSELERDEPFQPLVRLGAAGRTVIETLQTEPLVTVPATLGAVAAVDVVAFNSALLGKVRRGAQWLLRRWWR